MRMGIRLEGLVQPRRLLARQSEVAHGDFLRISGFGADLRDVGIYLPDGTHHGLATFTDEANANLCAILNP